jgi:hypothetical protein
MWATAPAAPRIVVSSKRSVLNSESGVQEAFATGASRGAAVATGVELGAGIGAATGLGVGAGLGDGAAAEAGGTAFAEAGSLCGRRLSARQPNARATTAATHGRLTDHGMGASRLGSTARL